jgi:hypothetical protein
MIRRGVIGSTSDFGSDSSGSSPGDGAAQLTSTSVLACRSQQSHLTPRPTLTTRDIDVEHIQCAFSGSADKKIDISFLDAISADTALRY